MSDPQAWEALFRRSIAAFYEGDLAEGRLACDRLLGVPDLPADVRETTRRNAVHYAPPIADLADGWSARRLDVPLAPGWAALNPVIVPDRADGSVGAADGVDILVRTANFRLEPPASYVVADGTGVVQSTYRLLRLNDRLEPTGPARPLLDLTPDDGMLDPWVRGNEDLRPVRIGDRWLTTGQAWRRDAAGGRNVRTALFDLDLAGGDHDPPLLANLRWLSRGDGIDEKNWMPVVVAGELCFVYCCAPTVVLACDPESGALALRAVHDAPALAGGFRGGSPLLPDGDGFLALVHEVAFWDDGARTYLHRLVRFDGALRIVAGSHPFRFHNENVEFALGLTRRGGRFLVSYGVMDREAWVAAVDAAALRALLRPLPELAPAGPRPHPLPRGALVLLDHQREPTKSGVPPAPVDPAAPAKRMDDEGLMTPAIDVVGRADSIRVGPPAPIGGRGERPFLVSMTLAGNAADHVGDALRSVVDWVDACLLIDTGIADATIDVARAVAGDKLLVRAFPWRDDFAAARNAAIAYADETGAEWSVFVDTDERIERSGADIRGFLAEAESDAVFLASADGSYQKERFFRLPPRGAYVGPTHECWIGPTRAVLPGAVFRELAKDESGLRRKLERDEAILRRHTAEHPDDPRWWYYLGDTLANLGRATDAIEAFDRCVRLDGWDEEGGWAAYRIARLLGDDLKRWDEAEAACARGLTRHPAMAELYWAAGYCAFWGGRPQRAAHWARVGIAINAAAAAGAIPERGGFKYVPAQWEGPWDVLRHALRVLGDDAGAAAAEHGHAAAVAAREGHAPD